MQVSLPSRYRVLGQSTSYSHENSTWWIAATPRRLRRRASTGALVRGGIEIVIGSAVARIGLRTAWVRMAIIKSVLKLE